MDTNTYSYADNSAQATLWGENSKLLSEVSPMLQRESISAAMVRGLQLHFEEDFYLRQIMPTLSHPMSYLTEKEFQNYTESE